MTVKELKARLDELDPTGEMLVTATRYSDGERMGREDWSIVTVVERVTGMDDGWLQVFFDEKKVEPRDRGRAFGSVHYRGN